jgi:hypothetical protein
MPWSSFPVRMMYDDELLMCSIARSVLSILDGGISASFTCDADPVSATESNHNMKGNTMEE